MLKKFISEAAGAYIQCAGWSEQIGAYIMGEGQVAHVESEIKRFAEMCKANGLNIGGFDPDDIGHNLWLSRNGHGSGFFDKPEKFGSASNTLQTLAKAMGEEYAFCDDGELHFE